MRALNLLGGVTCGNEPVALRAVPGAGPGTRKPGILSRESASTGPRDWAEGKANAAGGSDLGLKLLARECVTAGERPGTLSAGTSDASRLRAHGGRFLPTLAGALGLRPLSGALALLVAVPLAACEADHIGARATLQDWGYRGVGITAAPTFGRPCRMGEPFAVRFTAHDERGATVSGFLCASDEAAEDARILLDREGA